MKHLLLLIILSISMSENSNAQATKPKPCTAPECNQFDFWLGEWELTYNDTAHATNHITWEMDGCMVHEHFNDPANSYRGESWSVFNAQTKKWHQTWVDNQGAYIALTGEFREGKMILLTEPVNMPDGTRMQNRMVFYNISHNTFDWDWEATTDEGKTWKNNWRIHYKRKGS